MCTQLPVKAKSECFKHRENSNVEILYEPYHYLSKAPKQELRSKLVRSFNYWFKLPTDVVDKIVEIFDLSYDFIIIGDDLEDGSKLRRGVPACHRIFGVPWTFLSSNAVLFTTIKKIVALNKPKMLEGYIDEILIHYQGQCKEIYWEETLTCPSIQEYIDLINEKTGAFFKSFLHMYCAYANTDKNFTKFFELFGLFYQFQNDYSNLQIDKYYATKGFGEDITEGKFTVPIIHAIRTDTPEGRVVYNIVRHKTSETDMKKYCIELMDKLGSFKYAKQLLDDTHKALVDEIKNLGGNPMLIDVINTFNDWTNDEIYQANVIDKN